MNFTPPIAERETNELIRIANYPEKWNPLAVEQAKKELENRKVPFEQQQKKVKIWNRFYERKNEVTMQKRAEEGYDWLDVILHPIQFLLEILCDWNLKEDGYTRKHQQRKITLVLLAVIIALIYVLTKN